jgi:hypothetical protein
MAGMGSIGGLGKSLPDGGFEFVWAEDGHKIKTGNDARRRGKKK